MAEKIRTFRKGMPYMGLLGRENIFFILVLLFGGIDLVPAIYHLMFWGRNGRCLAGAYVLLYVAVGYVIGGVERRMGQI